MKLQRSIESIELVKDHQALALITLIALRADRVTGEARIGDWKEMGWASEKAYRSTKKRLLGAGKVAFRGTNKGTIAKLIDSSIYDINILPEGEQRGELEGGQGANKGASQGATIKKYKNIYKQEVQEIGVDSELWNEYLCTRKSLKAPNSKRALSALINKLKKLQSEGHSPNDLIAEANTRGWKSVFPPDKPKGAPNDSRNLRDTGWSARNKPDIRNAKSDLPRIQQGVQHRQGGSGEEAMVAAPVTIPG